MPIAGFCVLSIEDKVSDHSAFSRARHEPFRESDIFRRVSCGSSRLALRGLVSGEGFAVDASLIVADANKQRSIPVPSGRRGAAARLKPRHKSGAFSLW